MGAAVVVAVTLSAAPAPGRRWPWRPSGGAAPCGPPGWGAGPATVTTGWRFVRGATLWPGRPAPASPTADDPKGRKAEDGPTDRRYALAGPVFRPYRPGHSGHAAPEAGPQRQGWPSGRAAARRVGPRLASRRSTAKTLQISPVRPAHAPGGPTRRSIPAFSRRNKRQLSLSFISACPNQYGQASGVSWLWPARSWMRAERRESGTPRSRSANQGARNRVGT